MSGGICAPAGLEREPGREGGDARSVGEFEIRGSVMAPWAFAPTAFAPPACTACTSAPDAAPDIVPGAPGSETRPNPCAQEEIEPADRVKIKNCFKNVDRMFMAGPVVRFR